MSTDNTRLRRGYWNQLRGIDFARAVERGDERIVRLILEEVRDDRDWPTFAAGLASITVSAVATLAQLLDRSTDEIWNALAGGSRMSIEALAEIDELTEDPTTKGDNQ